MAVRDQPTGLSLSRAYAALGTAELTTEPGERYLAAHLAALQVAAIVLAARGRVDVAAARGPQCPWQLLSAVAPELGEWATFFALTEGKREAVRAGARGVVTARESDDLVREVQRFAAVVEGWLRATARRERQQSARALPREA